LEKKSDDEKREEDEGRHRCGRISPELHGYAHGGIAMTIPYRAAVGQ